MLQEKDLFKNNYNVQFNLNDKDSYPDDQFELEVQLLVRIGVRVLRVFMSKTSELTLLRTESSSAQT